MDGRLFGPPSGVEGRSVLDPALIQRRGSVASAPGYLPAFVSPVRLMSESPRLELSRAAQVSLRLPSPATSPVRVGWNVVGPSGSGSNDRSDSGLADMLDEWTALFSVGESEKVVQVPAGSSPAFLASDLEGRQTWSGVADAVEDGQTLDLKPVSGEPLVLRIVPPKGGLGAGLIRAKAFGGTLAVELPLKAETVLPPGDFASFEIVVEPNLRVDLRRSKGTQNGFGNHAPITLDLSEFSLCRLFLLSEQGRPLAGQLIQVSESRTYITEFPDLQGSRPTKHPGWVETPAQRWEFLPTNALGEVRMWLRPGRHQYKAAPASELPSIPARGAPEVVSGSFDLVSGQELVVLSGRELVWKPLNVSYPDGMPVLHSTASLADINGEAVGEFEVRSGHWAGWIPVSTGSVRVDCDGDWTAEVLCDPSAFSLDLRLSAGDTWKVEVEGGANRTLWVDIQNADGSLLDGFGPSPTSEAGVWDLEPGRRRPEWKFRMSARDDSGVVVEQSGWFLWNTPRVALVPIR